ncbi:response regulator transcription factor [Novosphingobium sediminicola]|uniref:Two-component system response regulator FixJ n=1 Tax=Novosphingobium sediminicola TaxID=563162 RepID=A0A7W6G9L3_9SPHN|nr:response regulator [Novosphingobium sediminicola]MBB3957177.1 two-component system response regulator FixJ [Novosphingobium sediminicola]
MHKQGLVHIVDDEDSVRRSLDFLLRTSGYRVERWMDGNKFLDCADNSVAACVLMDIRMPGLDGLTVLERMAGHGLNFPVIVLTGHGDITLAVQAMRGGAIDFLEKPFDRERLIQSIELGFRQIDDRTALFERAQWARGQTAKLTEREREVLDGLACGYPNKTIAYDLGISSRTVEVYRANIMEKLVVTNFADALRIAFAAGLGREKHWKQTHRIRSRTA